jgi:threonine synthase
MKYYSLNSPNEFFSLEHALFSNLGMEGGLYMPETIPQLFDDFYASLPNLSLKQIAEKVLTPFFGDIKSVVDSVFSFDVPVVSLDERTNILELFHGPTLSFKDFGTRFMAAIFQKIRKNSSPLTILCATSGDTGSAVAHAFLGHKNVKVFVLYPAGKVSKMQEQQFATLGDNITAIEVAGTFDDCQKLVKAAFADKKYSFVSANSINLARLLPQIVYYFYGVAQLMPLESSLVVTVPSGNFGNLTAGLIAQKMGLPISHFIAAVNANRTVLDFFESGTFTPRPSLETLSNAMDVGNPNNFPRVRKLFADSFSSLKDAVSCFSITDEETKNTISSVYKKNNYLFDPHGAVGYAATEKYRKKEKFGGSALILHTAHPAKFPEVVTPLVGNGAVKTPERLEKYLSRKKISTRIKNDYKELVALLN